MSLADTTALLAYISPHTSFNSHHNTSLLKMSYSAPQHQMATQATNKTTDPSDVVMKNTRHHQTTTEVEEEHKAKATSKTNLEVAKQQHISHTA